MDEGSSYPEVGDLFALRELPADVIVPAGVTLTPESGARLVEYLRDTRSPSADLRDLMAADGD